MTPRDSHTTEMHSEKGVTCSVSETSQDSLGLACTVSGLASTAGPLRPWQADPPLLSLVVGRQIRFSGREQLI